MKKNKQLYTVYVIDDKRVKYKMNKFLAKAIVRCGKHNVLVLKTTLFSQYKIVNREDLKEFFLLRDKRILHNFSGWEISSEGYSSRRHLFPTLFSAVLY